MRDLAHLTAGDFEPHAGTSFVTDRGGARVPLLLVEVEAHGHRPGGARQPFSLLFRGPASAPLPQRAHRLEHGVLCALKLFLVPVGIEGTDLLYEAIFN